MKTYADYEKELNDNYHQWLKNTHPGLYNFFIFQLIRDDLSYNYNILQERWIVQRNGECSCIKQDNILFADINSIIFNAKEHAEKTIKIMGKHLKELL